MGNCIEESLHLLSLTVISGQKMPQRGGEPGCLPRVWFTLWLNDILLRLVHLQSQSLMAPAYLGLIYGKSHGVCFSWPGWLMLISVWCSEHYYLKL